MRGVLAIHPLVLPNVGWFAFSPSLKFVPQEGILVLETAVLLQGEGSNC